MNDLCSVRLNKESNQGIFKLPLILTLMLVLLNSCYVKEKMQKLDRGKADADFIMSNLSKPEVIERFPEKYFLHEHVKPFIDTLAAHCEFDKKEGKFVDFFTMLKNGKSSTAYICEYFLNCDSLRFIYVYDFETAEPELMNFKVEDLEQPNPMIIYPEKSLLNSKPQRDR